MIAMMKKFRSTWNNKGINAPVMRDPKTGKGSITASLVVISCICVVISLVTNKLDKSGAFQFYLASIGVYLGRKITNKDGSIIDSTLDKTKKKN